MTKSGQNRRYVKYSICPTSLFSLFIYFFLIYSSTVILFTRREHVITIIIDDDRRGDYTTPYTDAKIRSRQLTSNYKYSNKERSFLGTGTLIDATITNNNNSAPECSNRRLSASAVVRWSGGKITSANFPQTALSRTKTKTYTLNHPVTIMMYLSYISVRVRT